MIKRVFSVGERGVSPQQVRNAQRVPPECAMGARVCVILRALHARFKWHVQATTMGVVEGRIQQLGCRRTSPIGCIVIRRSLSHIRMDGITRASTDMRGQEAHG